MCFWEPCWAVRLSYCALQRAPAQVAVHNSADEICGAGSVFGQIRVALNDPTRIPSVAGAALPASSNFFVRRAALAHNPSAIWPMPCHPV